METIVKIRRLHYSEGETIKGISRKLGLSRNTVRKVLRSGETKFVYERTRQPRPMLEEFIADLEKWLKEDEDAPKRRRRTIRKLHQGLKKKGYIGSYDAVHHYIRIWRAERRIKTGNVYIPLEFSPGEAFQFDWSEEEVVLAGEVTKIKVAHIRLCYSRHTLLVAYPNERLEMVQAAHRRAFAFFEGVCQRGIYDNMKTAVTEVRKGKERVFNEQFLQLCAHYCYEPVACTPAAGWEKGQVERQVGYIRQNFFTPLKEAASLEELNEQLEKACVDWAKTHPHPEQKDKTIWQMYESEKPFLRPDPLPFNGYKVEWTTVNSCALVRYETNAYSVEASYAHESVEMRVFADKIIIAKKGKVIGEHERSFKRHQTFYDPLHYLSVLERKPGALRNGAPFKNWKLPSSLANVKRALKAYKDGDKQFISLLLAIKTHGLEEVSQACSLALKQGSCNKTLIFNYLENQSLRHSQKETPSPLNLQRPPESDCGVYNIMLTTPPAVGRAHAYA